MDQKEKASSDLIMVGLRGGGGWEILYVRPSCAVSSDIVRVDAHDAIFAHFPSHKMSNVSQ